MSEKIMISREIAEKWIKATDEYVFAEDVEIRNEIKRALNQDHCGFGLGK